MYDPLPLLKHEGTLDTFEHMYFNLPTCLAIN